MPRIVKIDTSNAMIKESHLTLNPSSVVPAAPVLNFDARADLVALRWAADA